MGNPLKREHISDMQGIYGAFSHLSNNIYPHPFFMNQIPVDVGVIMVITLTSACDSIRGNHAYVRDLILLLLEFATEWKQQFH